MPEYAYYFHDAGPVVRHEGVSAREIEAAVRLMRRVADCSDVAQSAVVLRRVVAAFAESAGTNSLRTAAHRRALECLLTDVDDYLADTLLAECAWEGVQPVPAN